MRLAEYVRAIQEELRSSFGVEATVAVTVYEARNEARRESEALAIHQTVKEHIASVLGPEIKDQNYRHDDGQSWVDITGYDFEFVVYYTTEKAPAATGA